MGRLGRAGGIYLSMEHVLKSIWAWFVVFLPNLLGALATLFIGFYLARVLMRIVKKALLKSKVDPTMHAFLCTVVKIGVQVLTLLTAAGVLGIPITSFVTLLGGAAVAISLALQNSLSNVASGLLLLFNHPFKVGDYVEVNGLGGTVESIQLMNTALITADQKRMIVPNATMTSQTLVNYSAQQFRRVDFTFGISYESDCEKARQVVLAVIAAHPLCLMEPAPRVAVKSLDQSCVTLVAQVWCECERYWDLFYDFHQRVKEAFDTNGIVIPFPQVVVHQAQ